MESFSTDSMTPLSAPNESCPRIFIYSFPHADEPLGSYTIDLLLNHKNLPPAHWHIVRDPDPDLVSYNRRWREGQSLEDFIYGSFRPEHLSHELDYYFPSAWKNFQLSEYIPGAHRCIEGICGHDNPADHAKITGTLPESGALARQWKIIRPHLIVALHDTHTGGMYHFNLKKPSQQTLERLRQACPWPHLGEPVDGGYKWTRKYPEAIKEPRLEDHLQRLRKSKWFDEQYQYYVPISAGMWIESNLPNSDFFVPEAGHFADSSYADTDPAEDQITVERERYKSKYGNTTIREYAHIELPDKSKVRFMVAVYPDDKQVKTGQQVVTKTRGHFACEAVVLRRWIYEQTDKYWSLYRERFGKSLYALDRARISVPSAYAHQNSLRWFRKDPRYHRPATKAERADFKYRWTIHSLARVGYLVNELERIGADSSSLRQLVKNVIDFVNLPSSHRSAINRKVGAQSQLDRVLIMIDTIEKETP